MTGKNPKVRTNADGTKTYGPYKGSKQNDGRPTKVHYDPKTQKMGSTNAARDEKEQAVGRKLPKDQHVAHRSGTNKSGGKSISASSTRVESAKKNIGDGNKTRKKKRS